MAKNLKNSKTADSVNTIDELIARLDDMGLSGLAEVEGYITNFHPELKGKKTVSADIEEAIKVHLSVVLNKYIAKKDGGAD